MKALIYSYNFLPHMGGLERNTATLAACLQDMDHEVTVLTETLAEKPLQFPFEVLRRPGRAEQLRCIRRVDVIFTNGGLAMKICIPALLLRKRYVPVYQTSDLFQREHGGFLSAAFRRFIARGAALSITVSHFAAVEMERLLPGHPVCPLPNPIGPELEQAALRVMPMPAKVYDVLFVGRLIDGKGVFHLLEALSKLKSERNLDLHAAFAGEGEHQQELEASIRSQKLQATLLGRLDKRELVEAYLRSRVLAVPSSTHTEGNPLVIAEALSLGIPVIASDQPAMVEAIGNAGVVFKRGDPHDLAEKLALLLQQPHLDEAARNTNARKMEFSYETYSKRLQGILLQLKLATVPQIVPAAGVDVV